MEAKCYRAMRRAQGKMLRVSSRHFHGQKYGTAKNASTRNRGNAYADRSPLDFGDVGHAEIVSDVDFAGTDIVGRHYLEHVVALERCAIFPCRRILDLGEDIHIIRILHFDPFHVGHLLAVLPPLDIAPAIAVIPDVRNEPRSVGAAWRIDFHLPIAIPADRFIIPAERIAIDLHYHISLRRTVIVQVLVQSERPGRT